MTGGPVNARRGEKTKRRRREKERKGKQPTGRSRHTVQSIGQFGVAIGESGRGRKIFVSGDKRNRQRERREQNDEQHCTVVCKT